MNIKLKVGSYYLNRCGKIRKITSKNSHGSHPFNDDSGCCYTENGRYYGNEYIDDRDLIKEVRVTIEEVERVSEFIMLKNIIDDVFVHGLLLDEYRRDCIINEIERLQKLFEVNEND